MPFAYFFLVVFVVMWGGCYMNGVVVWFLLCSSRGMTTPDDQMGTLCWINERGAVQDQLSHCQHFLFSMYSMSVFDLVQNLQS